MIVVGSHDRYGYVAEFDPETGRPGPVRRLSRDARDSIDIQGHYSKLPGAVAVFYRYGGALWLRLGSEARNLDDPDVEVRWERSGADAKLELIDHGQVIASARYQPEWGGGPDDPTPFAEPEHFDFGLFVTTVLKDQARRRRIYDGPYQD